MSETISSIKIHDWKNSKEADVCDFIEHNEDAHTSRLFYQERLGGALFNLNLLISYVRPVNMLHAHLIEQSDDFIWQVRGEERVCGEEYDGECRRNDLAFKRGLKLVEDAGHKLTDVQRKCLLRLLDIYGDSRCESDFISTRIKEYGINCEEILIALIAQYQRIVIDISDILCDGE